MIGFYGISTVVGYLMPLYFVVGYLMLNPLYTYMLDIYIYMICKHIFVTIVQLSFKLTNKLPSSMLATTLWGFPGNVWLLFIFSMLHCNSFFVFFKSHFYLTIIIITWQLYGIM